MARLYVHGTEFCRLSKDVLAVNSLRGVQTLSIRSDFTVLKKFQSFNTNGARYGGTWKIYLSASKVRQKHDTLESVRDQYLDAGFKLERT
jgi:hypothetical protein